MMRQLAAVFVALLFLIKVVAYSPTAVPFLSREEIAGIWRLTPTKSFLPVANKEEKEETGTLLMLNEDGSFLQYGDDSSSVESSMDDNEQEATTKSSASTGSIMGLGILKGMWDYTGNKLILASDRPQNSDGRKVHDTILIGEMLANVRKSLSDNPVLPFEKENNNTALPSESDAPDTKSTTDNDVYLSIPNGDISIGKFMYPKRHPSFFEQPMLFQPTTTGKFGMRQVLGKLNTKLHSGKEDSSSTNAEQKIAKYHKQDFYGRKFLLTTMPAQPWVQEMKQSESMSQRGEEEEPEDYPSFDIRVMPIEFFANNTFCAIGSSKILRGRFGITGEERDQLWFQVSLFGSGRSVSGSVYSEGSGLTQEDRRGYVGPIEEMDTEDSNRNKLTDKSSSDSEAPTLEKKALFVRGSVVYGSDLARERPHPVLATFTMREVVDFVLEQDGDEDDDDSEDFSESESA